MEIIKEITDKSIPQRKIIGLFLLSFSLMMLVSSATGIKLDYGLQKNIAIGGIALGYAILSLLIHELLHALFLKIYTGKAKIGVKWVGRYGGLVGYASSNNALMRKQQYVITLLAPQILSLILIPLSLIPTIDIVYRFVFQSVWLVNMGGGCIDLYCVYLLRKEKGYTHVQYTESGMNLLRSTEQEVKD